MSKLIDNGAIAADYYMTGFLSRPQNQDYSSRAGNAAYCVADESNDAFRRFHTALYTKDIQPSESGTSFPDNAKLTELAREAGVVGKVPRVHQGRQVPADGRRTGRVGGHSRHPDGPDQRQGLPVHGNAGDFVAKIKEIVGDVPGLDSACDPSGVVTSARRQPNRLGRVDDSQRRDRSAVSVRGERVVGRGRGGASA